jgi:UPF0755 protein
LKIFLRRALENKPLRPLRPTRPTITPIGIQPQPISGQPSGLQKKKDPTQLPFSISKKVFTLICVGIVIIALIITGFIIARNELSPVSKDTTKLVGVTINTGSKPSAIGNLLQKDGIIKSSFAFMIYTRVSGTENKLQAGTYRLSPGQTTQEIVKHLVNGTVDQFSITFLPGATEAMDRQVLINAGYSDTDVDTALAGTYSGPLFAGKPTGSDLEGYIYGETYDFNSGATVQDILQRTFDQFETVVTQNNLVAGFAKQGLTLYQGITLASIIQREVSNASDQKQVAQVFYLRLAMNIPLGSDVTYIYGASLLGVAATPTLDSPYNTRINDGLPPGPIATPGLTALQATANPASGSYLYFLSGDDGKTYFATTEAQHEANIANYCKVKCAD